MFLEPTNPAIVVVVGIVPARGAGRPAPVARFVAVWRGRLVGRQRRLPNDRASGGE